MFVQYLHYKNILFEIKANDKAITNVVALFDFYDKDYCIEENHNNVTQQCVDELNEYLQGKRKVFSVKISPQGTSFQKRVWAELSKIEYGTTNSYALLAKNIATVKYARAVGGALNKNPILIIIPCHRVVSSNGDIGGFAGGVELKKELLSIENIL